MNINDMQDFANRTVVNIRALNDWEMTFFNIDYRNKKYVAMVFDDGIALYFPIPFKDDDVVQIEYPDQIRTFVEEEMWTHS